MSCKSEKENLFVVDAPTPKLKESVDFATRQQVSRKGESKKYMAASRPAQEKQERLEWSGSELEVCCSIASQKKSVNHLLSHNIGSTLPLPGM